MIDGHQRRVIADLAVAAPVETAGLRVQVVNEALRAVAPKHRLSHRASVDDQIREHLPEAGNPADMIEVGVGEQHTIELPAGRKMVCQSLAHRPAHEAHVGIDEDDLFAADDQVGGQVAVSDVDYSAEHWSFRGCPCHAEILSNASRKSRIRCRGPDLISLIDARTRVQLTGRRLWPSGGHLNSADASSLRARKPFVGLAGRGGQACEPWPLQSRKHVATRMPIVP